MHYKIIVLLYDESFEQIFNGQAIRHEFGGSQHETYRDDNVEQCVNDQWSGFKHYDGNTISQRTQTRQPVHSIIYILYIVNI